MDIHSPHHLPQPPPNETAGEEALLLDIKADYAPHVSERRLRLALETTLRYAGRPDAEMSLVITDDETIQELNRTYRGIDAPTDVLSFGTQPEAEDPFNFIGGPETTPYLGDVLISYPVAAGQAGVAGHPVMDELCLLAVHGTLHLLGYDHATVEDEKAMWDVQETVLSRIGIQLQVPRHFNE